MESKKYRTNGTEDAQTTDGGDDPFVYEVGTNIGINPLGPVAYWDAADWVDATMTLPDGTGNDHNATASAAMNKPTPGTDSRGAYLSFDGADD